MEITIVGIVQCTDFSLGYMICNLSSLFIPTILFKDSLVSSGVGHACVGVAFSVSVWEVELHEMVDVRQQYCTLTSLHPKQRPTVL